MEAVKNSPNTLGDKIEELAALRDQKRALNAELKDINKAFEALEIEILDLLDQQGTQFAGSNRHRATISESTVPTVTDWDEFYAYVLQQQAPYLLERRVSVAAWRELVESGEPVPGTEPYTRRSLSLRKL